MMEEMGVPAHLNMLTRNLFADSSAAVRLDGIHSLCCEPSKGVRQGCVLSSILLKVYGEYIVTKSLDGWKGGARIGGEIIRNLIRRCSPKPEDMKELLDRVEKNSDKLGLTLNRNKTKVMIVNRAGSSSYQDYEIVSSFTYLCSRVDNNGGSSAEIWRRFILQEKRPQN